MGVEWRKKGGYLYKYKYKNIYIHMVHIHIYKGSTGECRGYRGVI